MSNDLKSITIKRLELIMDKFDKIDEIVSEYITNSGYDASDAMEDIIQVLDDYYNKIKEKKNE